jgi:hypothetical protein
VTTTDPTVPASDAARLDELAEVTREYATYSRTAYGTAAVMAGIAALAAIVADASGHSGPARLAFMLLPAGWLLLLAAARAYYQRHGIVVEPAQRLAYRGVFLAFVYLLCAAMAAVQAVFLAANMLRDPAPPFVPAAGPFATMVTLAAAVAVPVLAAVVVHSRTDWMLTSGLVGLALFAALRPPPTRPDLANLSQAILVLRWGILCGLPVLAGAMVVSGVRDHARYRRLERRLAALKGAA